MHLGGHVAAKSSDLREFSLREGDVLFQHCRNFSLGSHSVDPESARVSVDEVAGVFGASPFSANAKGACDVPELVMNE